jgi:hypothetical protein
MCNYLKGIKEKQDEVTKYVLIILRESKTNEIFDFRHVILCRNIDHEGRSDVFCGGKYVLHYNNTNSATVKILRGLKPKFEVRYMVA